MICTGKKLFYFNHGCVLNTLIYHFFSLHPFLLITLAAERDREARTLAIEKQELVAAMDGHFAKLQTLSSEKIR